MKRPEEYVGLLMEFDEGGFEAVKVEDTNREDWVCFIMAAHCLELPVEVLYNKKVKAVIFRRKVAA